MSSVASHLVDGTGHLIDPVTAAAYHLSADRADSYQLRADAGWWHFDPVTDRPLAPQGWKLHVSAVPVHAVATLRAVAAVVMPLRLRFKSARSLSQLVRLCTPPTPLPQVGKFITVYVDGDEPLDGLAQRLHEATCGFDAPGVPSDRRWRRGSNVYLRYGGFTANDSYAGEKQLRSWFIVDPQGRRVADERAPRRYRPEWVPPPPGLTATPVRVPRGGDGLFGRGIAIREVLHQSAKGGVYRGRWRDREVVVKEGRAGTCPDALGRDATARLRNEWLILRRLAGTGLAPQPLDVFIEQGNAYLVEEFLPGVTLRRRVEEINYREPVTTDALHDMCRRVGELADALRAHGVNPRDFTPNNILVDGDRYRAIDVELFELACSPEPSFDGWTPGYARPRGEGRAGPDDGPEYALAAVRHFILTGIDPWLGSSARIGDHVEAILDTFGPDDTGAVAADLHHVRTHLAAPAAAAPRRPASTPPSEQVLAEAVEAGEELVARAEWDNAAWPWPQRWAPQLFHPACLHSGIGGVARFYLDLWAATGQRTWLDHTDELLEWTCARHPYLAGHTPAGLHFGHGALPWLMDELAAADPRRRTMWRRRADALADALADGDHAGFDITHGWAGIGLTQLALLNHRDDGHRRNVVAAVADRLLAHAEDHDGATVWPQRSTASYGFAHGSAGIGHFLLHAGAATADATLTAAAYRVARSLRTAGEPVAGGHGTSWHHGPGGSGPLWTHWCNGAAGVGTFLLAAATHSGDPQLLDTAVRAGRAITGTRPYGSCCRCHGLAGDGDYLLDLADATGAEEFHAGARRIGRKLDALKIRSGFCWTWPQEGDGLPRPSYMRGYLGVHAFRLRLAGLLPGSPLRITTTARRTP